LLERSRDVTIVTLRIVDPSTLEIVAPFLGYEIKASDYDINVFKRLSIFCEIPFS